LLPRSAESFCFRQLSVALSQNVEAKFHGASRPSEPQHKHDAPRYNGGMSTMPPALNHRSNTSSTRRPAETPVRNQINALVQSAGKIAKVFVHFVAELCSWC
jgi:hypothetical protein